MLPPSPEELIFDLRPRDGTKSTLKEVRKYGLVVQFSWKTLQTQGLSLAQSPRPSSSPPPQLGSLHYLGRWRPKDKEFGVSYM